MLTARGGVLSALLVCLAVAPASAQYRFDPFTTSNGLPQNTVSAVLQTRDGYLWIATYGGLVRYDGVRFTTSDKDNTPAIRSTQFLSLFEDGADTIWVGTVEGGVIRYRHGRFTALDEHGGLARNFVERTQESPAGVLLFHSLDNATLVAPSGAISRAGEAAERVFVGPSRATWTRDATRITRTLDGTSTVYAVDVPIEDFARLRYETRDGTLWIGLREGGVVRLSGGVVSRFGAADGVPIDQTVRIGGEDLAGRVWLQAANDVLVFDERRFQKFDLGAPAPQIRAVACDRENTVWIGTNNRGLVHVVPGVPRTHSEADGLPSASVYPLAEDRDGSILAGSAGNVTRWSNGRVTSFALPRAARSLFVDPDGTLWIGTSPGLMTMSGGRLVDRSALVPGTGIDAILRDRRGVIWAGGLNGLFRMDW